MSTLFVLGLDLSSAYDIIVPKRGKAIVKTDIAIAIPSNTYARIGAMPRITFVGLRCIDILISYRLALYYSSKKWSRSEAFHRCRSWRRGFRLSW